MGRKLTDAQVAEVRRRAAAGESKADLARAFSVSRSHVYRVAAGEQRAALEAPGAARDGAVSDAVRDLVKSIELEPGTRVIAESALAIAGKLDAAAASDAIAAAAAAPALARQLAELVASLPGAPGWVDRAMEALAAARGRDQ